MTEQPQHSLAEPLLAQLSGRFSPAELDQVAHAFDVADRWHEGQRRKSGDRYITHPLAVAEAAATLRLGCTMVCAALLHDVLEDTDCDPELLRAEFGAEVADLVERHMALSHGEEAPDDDQAITLQLLDRLHNMRTIEYLDAGQQLSRSRQTLELLVPQARRLGLPVVADELQELARHRIERLAGEGGGMAATLCALQIGSLMLPAAARSRYREEWAAELGWPANRCGRRRFARQLLLGLPRLSIMLRRPQWDDRCAGIVHRVAANRLIQSGLKTLQSIARRAV
jgi:hypothetical protein